MTARWPGRWVPRGLVRASGLDNGCQVNVYVSPPGVIRRLSGGPDVYLGVDAGLESSKKLKFPG